MPVERSSRRVASKRLEQLARELLGASPLFALATVGPGGRAHVNTAYFAASPAFEVIWLSAPEARHSANLRVNSSAAAAVYDSTQTWGGHDRGIQLFGSARELRGRASAEAERLYAERFPRFRSMDLPAYRWYRLRPRRLKLFHEPDLGRGIFVTAAVRAGGRLVWSRTDVYAAA